MIDLRDRPIAITGASSGIGAATAIACAQAGMPVVIAARRVEKLEAVANRIRQIGGRVHLVACDVVDPAQCRAVIEQTVAQFGSIYSVFANAGYGEEVSLLEMPDADVRAMFEANFFGTLNVIRPAAEHMLKGKWGAGRRSNAGHILICSSCLGRMTIPYYGIYCASKASQLAVGRAMATELYPKGIHVSTVHPIGTKTEFFDTAATRSAGRSALTAHSSERFMQTPEFVAGRILRCLKRPKLEVWTGFTGVGVRLGMAICAAFPGIENQVVRRMVKTRTAKAVERAPSASSG